MTPESRISSGRCPDGVPERDFRFAWLLPAMSGGSPIPWGPAVSWVTPPARFFVNPFQDSLSVRRQET